MKGRRRWMLQERKRGNGVCFRAWDVEIVVYQSYWILSRWERSIDLENIDDTQIGKGEFCVSIYIKLRSHLWDKLEQIQQGYFSEKLIFLWSWRNFFLIANIFLAVMVMPLILNSRSPIETKWFLSELSIDVKESNVKMRTWIWIHVWI